jgi:hypothetical protein
MSLIRINRNPSRRQLAVFCVLWAVFFGLLGVAALRRGTTSWAIAFGVVAVCVPALGRIVPGMLRFIYVSSAYLTLPIGWVVSHLVLAGVYYAVLTPIGLAMRCFGYDPMGRSFNRASQTYWIARQEPDRVDRYFRQF